MVVVGTFGHSGAGLVTRDASSEVNKCMGQKDGCMIIGHIRCGLVSIGHDDE